MNEVDELRKLDHLGLTNKQKRKILHRLRMANIPKSTLDPEIWELFIRMSPALGFCDWLPTWNEYLSLLMVSRSTYQVILPQYQQDWRSRLYIMHWVPPGGWSAKMPRSLTQKNKIAERSEIGRIVSGLTTSR